MYCNNCGTKNEDGSMFCKSCGKKVTFTNGDAQQEQLAPNVQVNNYVKQMEAMNIRIEQEERLEEYNVKIKRYNQNRKVFWGIMVFGILLMICMYMALGSSIMGTSNPSKVLDELSGIIFPIIIVGIVPLFMIIPIRSCKQSEKKYIEKKEKLEEKMKNNSL